jgi:hypothetical protein
VEAAEVVEMDLRVVLEVSGKNSVYVGVGAA